VDSPDEASAGTRVYRSLRTGRVVTQADTQADTQAERIAAARTRIVVDRRRGVETAPWIVELAKERA
jgi:hypothetical protein